MKITHLLVLTFFGIVSPFPARAASLNDAHRAFAAGKFHESTQAYEAAIAKRGYSGPVLFDLGNSYYREGNFAQAILAYKRAQWLSPNDSDIAANLAQAQKQAGLAVTSLDTAEKFGRVLSASGWAWLGCGAWTILCFSLLARIVLGQQRVMFTSAGILGVLGLLTAVFGMIVSSKEIKEAVVIEKNASALISPFPAAQAVFTPAPGETVTLEKSYNDFLLVTDHAGHSGWISKAQLSPIIPE